MSDDLRVIILEQESFLERLEKISPNVSQTVKEYISENQLSSPSSEHFDQIYKHTQSLSSEHAQAGNVTEWVSLSLSLPLSLSTLYSLSIFSIIFFPFSSIFFFF